MNKKYNNAARTRDDFAKTLERFLKDKHDSLWHLKAKQSLKLQILIMDLVRFLFIDYNQILLRTKRKITFLVGC